MFHLRTMIDRFVANDLEGVWHKSANHANVFIKIGKNPSKSRFFDRH